MCIRDSGYGGPTRGRDVTAHTTIDFLTATRGETISLQAADGKPFKVKIPAGVSDGQKIKLRGKGQPSPDGGEAGDTGGETPRARVKVCGHGNGIPSLPGPSLDG